MGPRRREIPAWLKQGFAELFEIESPPHALAAELGIGLVVVEAARLHEREHGLDEEPPTSALPVDGGELGLRGLQTPMRVDAKEERRVNSRRLNGFPEKCGRAGFREQSQAAWRLHADDADDRRCS